IGSEDSSPEQRKARRAQAKETSQIASKEIQAALELGSGFDDKLQRQVATAIMADVWNDAALFDRAVRPALETFQGVEGVEDLYWVAGLRREGAEKLRAFDQALAICPKHAL